MPKKIKFESFKYQFLISAARKSFESHNSQVPWSEFINNLNFEYIKGKVKITSRGEAHEGLTLGLEDVKFYLRGDSEKHVAGQRELGLLDNEDQTKLRNSCYFEEVVVRVANQAGYSNRSSIDMSNVKRVEIERKFHDEWANSEDVNKIDVIESNEVCTAPEMRYITKKLGSLKGKRLLDVGCGLGEASVYFALKGATVTSADLSSGMLDATLRLAHANGVDVKTHLAEAEDMQLKSHEKFDVIYAGNLLHHVNIEETVNRLMPHLDKNGVFISWDPLAYNPIINVYRVLASDVRTPDEHPLKLADIKIFKKYFNTVETKYFWFTTLLIFIIMALVQHKNPNKVRFWKAVVQEGRSWAWLYRPLAMFDRILLFIFPVLKLLCWNVVVFCRKQK